MLSVYKLVLALSDLLACGLFENKPYMLVTTKCTLVVVGGPDLRETNLDLNSGYQQGGENYVKAN